MACRRSDFKVGTARAEDPAGKRFLLSEEAEPVPVESEHSGDRNFFNPNKPNNQFVIVRLLLYRICLCPSPFFSYSLGKWIPFSFLIFSVNWAIVRLLSK